MSVESHYRQAEGDEAQYEMFESEDSEVPPITWIAWLCTGLVATLAIGMFFV